MAKHRCIECGEEYIMGGTGGTSTTSSKFLPINNFLFETKFLPVCNFCIEKRIQKMYELHDDSYWNFLDQLCQFLNIQFNPSLWEKLAKTHKYKTFVVYVNMMSESEYEKVNWQAANAQFLALEKEKLLEDEIPELKAARVKKLQEKWGMNYLEEDLKYLENLFNGILQTQGVNGGKMYDEAKKLCKISLMIDERIRAGEDFDKLLKSYESLTKITDFTPKNARNASDFESVGELFSWLEKRGWMNKYYDGVTKDIVDNTMKNIQTYVRNLYVNESSIGEEIDRRLEALKHIEEFENKFYDNDELNVDSDIYMKEAYDDAKDEFSEEF